MWDADADGYARGDGVAAVVLKLLKDAIADGDDIECIIRETAVNQDGRTTGITMPSSQAQTDLIHKAYSGAGLDLANPADRPQYFEAHGTGKIIRSRCENAETNMSKAPLLVIQLKLKQSMMPSLVRI